MLHKGGDSFPGVFRKGNGRSISGIRCLSGNPPDQRNSIIDYIVVSDGSGGLAGHEILAPRARIHDELITLAGGRNVFGDATLKWPQISREEILKRDPDVLIVPVTDVSDSGSIAWVYQTVGIRFDLPLQVAKLLLA